MNATAADDVLDVLIVGGGPVGAAAAALLAQMTRSERKPMRIAVLEPRRAVSPAPAAPSSGLPRAAVSSASISVLSGAAPSATVPSLNDAAPRASMAARSGAAASAQVPFDLRVSAYSRASEHILSAAGAWPAIAAGRHCPYERMRVWHESVSSTSSSALVFDASEVGEPNLGYIIENRLVQIALIDAAEEGGVQVAPAEFATLTIEDDYVRVETRTGETSAGTLRAKLVVGADGAQSAVRAAVGLTAETSGYQQTAIVANVATAKPHESTAWQRFLSTGTLAFLPLSDGTSSIVWSADDALAQTLFAASPEQFADELNRASDFALGETRLVSERASFPLRRLAAHHYATQRCALIGDAAHVVHPLAGQGVNLGLLDAAALTELIAVARREGEDPGALRVLRRYERWRKTETQMMSTAIDAFDRLLAHGNGPLARIAQRGLGWVNRSQELKRIFIRRALGIAGELPAAARLRSS